MAAALHAADPVVTETPFSGFQRNVTLFHCDRLLSAASVSSS